jgi:cytoskeleton protein RodZ
MDDKMTSGKVLGTGQSMAVDGEGKIRMRLGNAGGVEVTANGKPLGRLGSKGQVRTLEFTAAGFRAVSNTSALPK